MLSGNDPRTNLTIIVNWKLESFRRFKPEGLLKENSDEEIADAVRLAADAKTDRSGIAVLVGLSGVGIPVASAILTAMFPLRYTVIDKRALTSLGHPKNDGTIKFYIQYLAECRRLADLYKVELRTLDRALWQWRPAKDFSLTHYPGNRPR